MLQFIIKCLASSLFRSPLPPVDSTSEFSSDASTFGGSDLSTLSLTPQPTVSNTALHSEGALAATPFLRLPTELRFDIYELVVTSCDAISLDTAGNRPTFLLGSQSAERSGTKL